MNRIPLLSEQQTQGMNVPPVRAPSHAPALNLNNPAPPPMAPFPGVGTTLGCDAQRVQIAGGALSQLVVDPSITPFERLYRRLPEEGMFSQAVNPDNPFAFELGAFTVPETFSLLLFDLRPDIYRFSGIDAGDFMPVEARRFASRLGFQITVDQRQPGQLDFQLDPIAIQTTQQAFTRIAPPSQIGGEGDIAPASVFNIARSNSFAGAAGAGTSLMPQRPTRYGPQSVPFTLHVRSTQTVQLRCVVYQPIPSPIAFIEYDIAGMLMPSKVMDELMRCTAPTTGSGPR